MSSTRSLRRQLADAHQELRDRENAVEEAVAARDIELAELRADRKHLLAELDATRLELRAIVGFAQSLEQQARRTLERLSGARVASGNSQLHTRTHPSDPRGTSHDA